jgi:hypothetical protein
VQRVQSRHPPAMRASFVQLRCNDPVIERCVVVGVGSNIRSTSASAYEKMGADA